MKPVVRRSAGLDVHRNSIVVTVSTREKGRILLEAVWFVPPEGGKRLLRQGHDRSSVILP